MMKEQFIEFLDEIQIPPQTTGLHRMKSLMKRLGNPQDQLKFVHVAGTNGKGSVCAMLTSILMEAGYKVGLFTSPHLIDYNERIQIQRAPISDKDFGEIGMEIRQASLDMADAGEEMPRFFDCITAMAFMYFARQNMDIVVLETGIGGRYDATNIIKNPLVSVITSIGKDHTAFLGDTIEAIAMEKGGIIKENCHTVLYDCDKSVYNIIKDICKNHDSPLFSCKETIVSNECLTIEGTDFDVENKIFTYKGIRLQLLGHYQISNAITTLMTVEALRSLGYHIENEFVYLGLSGAKWQGRMEVIQKEPVIIIDGAHNEESARAFASSLRAHTNKKKVYLLMGVLQDKDYHTILDILLPLAKGVIVTQCNYTRALPAAKLYEVIYDKNPNLELIMEKDLIKAYEAGRRKIEKNDILCCLGSLYLIGELKGFLQKQEESHAKI